MQYKYYNLPIDFPCVISSSGDAFENHFHNCIELGFCKHGNGTISINSIDFAFNEGDYFFIPENTSHYLHSDPDCESSWDYVLFDPHLLFKSLLPEEVFDNLLSDLRTCFGKITSDSDSSLHFLMKRIFSELNNKEPYYQDSLKGLLVSLLMLIRREKHNSYSSQSDYDWLYSAISYIRKNYYNKLTIAEIANTCCGLSESHFRKKFVQIMHISPLDYINQLRIQIACRLIYNNEKPISEIASEVGFTTLSSFNRNFHTLLGCSPSEWRKLYVQ